MKHLKLCNSSYVLYTSKGMKPFDKYHLNFSKLVKALREGSSEDIILELLKNPPTPDGVFGAFCHTKTNNLIYSITKGNSTSYYNADGTRPSDVSYIEFLGNYTSLQELFDNNPAYLL